MRAKVNAEASPVYQSIKDIHTMHRLLTVEIGDQIEDSFSSDPCSAARPSVRSGMGIAFLCNKGNGIKVESFQPQPLPMNMTAAIPGKHAS